MEKKQYIQPIVELTQLMPSAIVLAGSAGLHISGDPLGSGEGGD